MTAEILTDDERQLLIVLVTKALVDIRGDRDMLHEYEECLELLRKLGVGGAPMRIECHRVDPYRDDSYPERECDYCHLRYRGKTVYCSLACALSDA